MAMRSEEWTMPLVSSSAIGAIDYDAQSRTLRVAFHETGTYSFHGVPRSVYETFLSAPSKGRFFNQHIRDHYPSTR